jgi:hypothetical protein
MDQSATREPAATRDPDPPQVPLLRDRAIGIVATATVLALLYFGRDVLVPVTLAIILSLAVAPLVRALRRLGLGQTFSVPLTLCLVVAGRHIKAVSLLDLLLGARPRRADLFESSARQDQKRRSVTCMPGRAAK